MTINTRDFDDVLQEELQNPEFRDYWERTALARAVAHQVIRYRIEHGLSQSALARLLGVSQPVVARLEMGEHEPKISTLRKLSQRLGLRFKLDIHPTGRPLLPGDNGTSIERVAANGVELVVATA